MRTNAQDTASVFRVKPSGFSPFVEVSACFIEFEGKILFLKRAEGGTEGGKWGVPAGKIEIAESAREAGIRETAEETQIVLEDHRLKFVGELFVCKPSGDYVFHMYHQKLSCLPEVSVNDEHQEYRWLSMEDAVQLPLMSGGVEVLYHFKALANKTKLPRRPFYFIRHGETDLNVGRETTHVDCDPPLNHRGRNQAQMARKGIEDISFDSDKTDKLGEGSVDN